MQLRSLKQRPSVFKAFRLIDPVYRLLYRLSHWYAGPIPPFVNRRRAGNSFIGPFRRAGWNCYSLVREAIREHTDFKSEQPKILDLGAGVGRVLQYIVNEFSDLYACDVDSSATSWLAKAYPDVRVATNKFDPTLPYKDGFFDIVYSVSIWTHLPLEKQELWLIELSRVLKPGGLALLTTSGFTALRIRQCRDPEWRHVTHDQLEKAGIIYIEYPNFSAGARDFPGIEESYGLTAISPGYVREQWKKYFRIIDIQEGVIDSAQDLVVMRKAVNMQENPLRDG